MVMTKIPAQMIKTSGAKKETVVVVRAESLNTAQPNSTDISEITSGYFDASSGVLTLTQFDGETVRISGFPTSDKIPAGPTGPAGLSGKDGKDGKDGRDGAVGAAGCSGPQGLVGTTGPRGEQGRTGQQGPVGPTGPLGIIGLQGKAGPTGPQGPEGPQGQRGDMGPRGKPGIPGKEGVMNIVVSTTEPPETDREDGMLWVNPLANYAC